MTISRRLLIAVPIAAVVGLVYVLLGGYWMLALGVAGGAVADVLSRRAR